MKTALALLTLAGVLALVEFKPTPTADAAPALAPASPAPAVAIPTGGVGGVETSRASMPPVVEDRQPAPVGPNTAGAGLWDATGSTYPAAQTKNTTAGDPQRASLLYTNCARGACQPAAYYVQQPAAQPRRQWRPFGGRFRRG